MPKSVPTYDAANRLTSSIITAGDGSTTTSLVATFDPDGNQLTRSQTTTTSATGTTASKATASAYNALDWTVSTTDSVTGQSPHEVDYVYDASGQELNRAGGTTSSSGVAQRMQSGHRARSAGLSQDPNETVATQLDGSGQSFP